MSGSTNAEKADYLSRRRARMLPVLAIVYLSQQATYFSASGRQPVSAQSVKIGAWVVLTLVITFALVTKGFWFRPKAIRDMIDDESTRANRLEAMRIGFLFAIFAAVGAYFVDQFDLLTTRQAIQLIVSASLGSALIVFGVLERRGYKDA